jgi:hypothetical protein
MSTFRSLFCKSGKLPGTYLANPVKNYLFVVNLDIHPVAAMISDIQGTDHDCSGLSRYKPDQYFKIE